MVNVGKQNGRFQTETIDFEKGIIYAPIKKSFGYAIPKIQKTKKDGAVKFAEVKRKILEALNPSSVKTGKPVGAKKTLSFSLSLVPLSVCIPDGCRRHLAKSKLKDILLQDLEDHTNEGPQSLQEYAIVVNMVALINTILNKS